MGLFFLAHYQVSREFVGVEITINSDENKNSDKNMTSKKQAINISDQSECLNLWSNKCSITPYIQI